MLIWGWREFSYSGLLHALPGRRNRSVPKAKWKLQPELRAQWLQSMRCWPFVPDLLPVHTCFVATSRDSLKKESIICLGLAWVMNNTKSVQSYVDLLEKLFLWPFMGMKCFSPNSKPRSASYSCPRGGVLGTRNLETWLILSSSWCHYHKLTTQHNSFSDNTNSLTSLDGARAMPATKSVEMQAVLKGVVVVWEWNQSKVIVIQVKSGPSQCECLCESRMDRNASCSGMAPLFWFPITHVTISNKDQRVSLNPVVCIIVVHRLTLDYLPVVKDGVMSPS